VECREVECGTARTVKGEKGEKGEKGVVLHTPD
jgi:hypothetical protein